MSNIGMFATSMLVATGASSTLIGTVKFCVSVSDVT